MHYFTGFYFEGIILLLSFLGEKIETFMKTQSREILQIQVFLFIFKYVLKMEK